MTKRLIRNAIRTPDGTVLESRFRHDYVTYQDTNGKDYMVDGGLDYQRRSANGDEIDLCLYDDEPHYIKREVIQWGSYGANGDMWLRTQPIAALDTDHIKAILDTQNLAPYMKDIFEAELEMREKGLYWEDQTRTAEVRRVANEYYQLRSRK